MLQLIFTFCTEKNIIIPTKKNKLVENKLNELKYICIGIKDNGIKKYEKFLNYATLAEISPWIEVVDCLNE